jgi:hypothetical protein
MNVAMNKKGYDSFESVLNNGMQAIAVKTLNLSLEETGALILDTRKWCFFTKGFIPQSINIGIGLYSLVSALIADVKQPIILVTELGQEEESVTRLSRVGFDNLWVILQVDLKLGSRRNRCCT